MSTSLNNLLKTYQNNLFSKKGKVYYDYLKDLGLTEDTIKLRQLGVALPGDIPNFIRFSNFTDNICKDLYEFDLIQIDLEKSFKTKTLMPGTYVKENLINRITIPLYNENKTLVGIIGVSINEEDIKYIHAINKYNHIYISTLFGYQMCDFKDNTITILPDYLDILKLYQDGNTNLISHNGKSLISFKVIKLLNSFHNIRISTDFTQPKSLNKTLVTIQNMFEYLQPWHSLRIFNYPDNLEKDLEKNIKDSLNIFEFLYFTLQNETNPKEVFYHRFFRFIKNIRITETKLLILKEFDEFYKNI